MRRRNALLLAGAAALAAAGVGAAWFAGAFRDRERAVVYPTAAHFDPRGAWLVGVRGMVYEPAADSPARRAALSAFRKALGLREDAEEARIFRERAAPFLADREEEETVVLHMDNSLTPLPAGEDGLFGASFPAMASGIEPLARDRGPTRGWVEVRVARSSSPLAVLGRGWIQLVPPEGVTVVSDIDDTVKVTDVADRSEALANTFLREFRPVPGMAALYDRWAREGAAFLYLSAGPWPLYGPLSEFLEREGFPPGTFRMREFRWSVGGALDLLGPPGKFKGEALGSLPVGWPRRRLVLVGDSGEQDPEAYGAFARAHPDRVAAILIREVAPGGCPPERCAGAFAGLPEGMARVFRDPSELGPLPR